MTRITENTIEEFAIKLLEHLGYEYVYAPTETVLKQAELIANEIMNG